ncbi:MAG: hypothetical protein ACREJO_14675 [Phycisphaerales bacterium]
MHVRSTLAFVPALIVVAGLTGATAVWEARGEGGHAGGAAAGGRLLGFELKETKEELKLNYTVEAQDNGGGRMSVTFTLADEGRIKPLTSVDLAVPSKDGSGYFDVVVRLSPFERDGKKVYVMQLTRDLAERGEIDLKTHTMDGKQMIDWAYHRVVLEKYAKAAKPFVAPEAKKSGGAEGGPAPAKAEPAAPSTPPPTPPAAPAPR